MELGNELGMLRWRKWWWRWRCAGQLWGDDEHSDGGAFPTSRMLTEITGAQVAPNKAIVGANAFAHEAGIHQDGIIKNPLTYEIMSPQSVGVPARSLVLGKHSGRNALRLSLRDLGYEASDEELAEVL